MLRPDMQASLMGLGELREIAHEFYFRGATMSSMVMQKYSEALEGHENAPSTTTIEAAAEEEFNKDWDSFVREVALPLAKRLKQKGGDNG